MKRVLIALVVALAAAGAAPADGQAQQVRLAAAADCTVNPSCAPGLERVYGIDPTPGLVKLAVADAGVDALDDGLAEVAVVFSSNPQLSRPDIVSLRDDRHMITPDRVVPIVRDTIATRYGAPLRKRLNAASALLSTLQLRGLNQQVIDGRLPEAVGGGFVDAGGLGGEPAHKRAGPRIVIGYQEFAENETLAYLYAEALRGDGFRVTVRSAGGLRPETVRSLKRGRIDIYPGYSGSLQAYLGGKTLQSALARIHAQPMRLASAQDRNVFAMKSEAARALGVTKLSDLARFWTAAKTAAAVDAASEPEQDEQWAVQPQSILDLPAAWQLSQGAGVTVAIVDSGAKLDHPDLAPNIWTNFGEIPGNGVDDDHNGYVDDVHGVDLTSNSPDQNLSDGNGHGTHVAGIVAAAMNGRGVIGVAPKAKLMIIKILDASGAGTTGATAEGIRYAAANGAKVINVSIQGDDPDPRLNGAIAAAGAANALVVVSAGNSGRDIDAQPSYPAAIAAPNVIGVAATAPDDGKGIDPLSNYGRLNVQLAAPGDEILSTSNDGGYEFKSGTSMAAPMVSGVAALMAATNPQLGAADLRALLLQHATRSVLPVGAGYLDALDSVLSTTTAVGYDTTQPPQLRVLGATVKNGRTQVKAALLGSRAAVRSYRVLLDGRKRASLAARTTPFTVTLPKRAKKVSIQALDAAGKPLTTATRSVAALKSGKGGVGSGGGVGT
jgi:subtilisin family serine protease